VQTFEFSDESGLCKALNLYKLFVKPRAAYFSNKRLEAAPLNPAKPLSHESQSKRRMLKARCLREKTESLTLEISTLEAKPTQTYDSIEK
jgi:hypothetical protein